MGSENATPQEKTITVPAAIEPHLTSICEFVSLFHPGNMEEELWNFMSDFVEDKEEWELPPIVCLPLNNDLNEYRNCAGPCRELLMSVRLCDL